MSLNTAPNLARPDDFYEALIEMHRGLDDATSQDVNARLILLLANHMPREGQAYQRDLGLRA